LCGLARGRAHRRGPVRAGASGGPDDVRQPQQAADALIAAAQVFDAATIETIFGPDGRDLVVTGDTVQDRTAPRNSPGRPVSAGA
jgi:hypothetical protein